MISAPEARPVPPATAAVRTGWPPPQNAWRRDPAAAEAEEGVDRRADGEELRDPGPVGDRVQVRACVQIGVDVDVALQEVPEEGEGQEAAADRETEDVGCEHLGDSGLRPQPFFYGPARGHVHAFAGGQGTFAAHSGNTLGKVATKPGTRDVACAMV